MTNVDRTAVAANPLNPRDALGDLTELATSLATMGQLQPCTVVTRGAYLAQYPEHEPKIGSAAFIAVTGNRRLAAAAQADLPTLDVVVKDDLAESRQTLAAATIAENIERRDFDVLEEARAVQMLVTLCGSGTVAADRLARTKGWVSQRLALLRLSPEMKTLLRTGDLPIRDARRLAQLEPGEQLAAWQSEQEQRADDAQRFTAVNRVAAGPAAAGPAVAGQSGDPAVEAGPSDSSKDVGSGRGGQIAKAIQRLGGAPPAIASHLREYLNPEQCRELAALLVVDLPNAVTDR